MEIATPGGGVEAMEEIVVKKEEPEQVPPMVTVKIEPLEEIQEEDNHFEDNHMDILSVPDKQDTKEDVPVKCEVNQEEKVWEDPIEKIIASLDFNPTPIVPRSAPVSSGLSEESTVKKEQVPAPAERPALEYPELVTMDLDTGAVTPYPSNSGDKQSSEGAQVHPPNLFFSVNGKVIMPVFTLEFLRILAEQNKARTNPPRELATFSLNTVYNEPEEKAQKPKKSAKKLAKPRKSKSTSKVKTVFTPGNEQSSSKPHRCKECGAKFARRGDLTNHFKFHHSNTNPNPHIGEPTFACQFCGVKFYLKSSVIRHVIRQHLEENTAQCPLCPYHGDIDEPDRGLYRHISAHLFDSCSGKSIKDQKSTNHKPTIKPEQKSPNTKNVSSHLSSKTKANSCKSSSKSSTTTSEKQIQIANYRLQNTGNSKVPPRKPVSSKSRSKKRKKSYSFSGSGKRHICLICRQPCKCPSDLATHMMTHTGERPFQCPLCDIQFVRKSNMILHLARLHCRSADLPPEPGRKSAPFVCRFCTAPSNSPVTLFKNKDAMYRHLSQEHQAVLITSKENFTVDN